MVGGSKIGRATALVWPVLVVLGCAIAAGCSSPGRADLFRNDKLHQRTGYEAGVGVDRPAFVAPVRDGRTDTVPAAAGGSPYYAFVEGRWDRPLDAMVDDVLRDEFEESGVFAELLDTATPESLIVQPILVQCTCGSIEKLSGGYQSLAEVSIRLAIYGPDPGDGVRPLIHDQIYTDRQASEPRLVPPESPLLLGRALTVTAGRILVGIDKSNVARSSLEGIETEALPELPELPPLRDR